MLNFHVRWCLNFSPLSVNSSYDRFNFLFRFKTTLQVQAKHEICGRSRKYICRLIIPRYIFLCLTTFIFRRHIFNFPSRDLTNNQSKNMWVMWHKRSLSNYYYDFLTNSFNFQGCCPISQQRQNEAKTTRSSTTHI
jgi:hypothetical protein